MSFYSSKYDDRIIEAVQWNGTNRHEVADYTGRASAFYLGDYDTLVLFEDESSVTEEITLHHYVLRTHNDLLNIMSPYDFENQFVPIIIPDEIPFDKE